MEKKIETVFPAKKKTLRDYLTEGEELKPNNGHITSTLLGKMIVGTLTEFQKDTEIGGTEDFPVVFDKKPGPKSTIIVKKVNAYSVRVKVVDD